MPDPKPIPVRDIIRKGPSPEAGGDSVLKLVVVSCADRGEPSAIHLVVDEVLSKIRAAAREAEVAKVYLPNTKIHGCVGCFSGGGRVCGFPCDRNSIESDIYKPDDGMLGVYDKIIDADALLLAADSRWGSVDHHTQRFIERLTPFPNLAAQGRPMLKRKVAGIVTVGDNALSTAGALMAALNAVGFAFPNYAYVAWNVPRSATVRITQDAFEQSKAVHDNAALLARDLVHFVRTAKES